MIFLSYTKISKDSLAKHYQKNKERTQKRHVKDIKIFLKKKKKKGTNIVAKDIKIFLKMKSKGWPSIEKLILKSGKTFHNGGI